MDTNDTEGSPLDLSVHCVECDAPTTVTVDSRLGIRADRRTIGALCSDDCARNNGRRWTDDTADTCSCGAAVDLADRLLFQAGRILGCSSCQWTGASVRHYMSVTGYPLCGEAGEPGKPLTSTTDRAAVNCPECVADVELIQLIAPVVAGGCS